MPKIIFMGTPDFAVESLKQLVEAGINVAAVVTSPDRPAGRGQQIKQSAVKEYASKQNLPVLQPEKLKSEEFIATLKQIDADLFVVVAFRMLPEIVWGMPKLGTINLHGSLLPQYRGAAPINWAVINGEKETGATTFFIEKEIDTGKIIDWVKIAIGPNDTAGDVHDELMIKGAKLLTKTVLSILNGTVTAKSQSDFEGFKSLKHAPKIFKPDCKIDWSDLTLNIHNKIRGLAPYPNAWTEIEKDGKVKSLKLFKTEPVYTGTINTGKIEVNEEEVKFGTNDGWIILKEIQLEGKKRMPLNDFIKGFNFNDCKLILN
jgi:methionyl-tRNA formyltransferase